MTKAADKIKTRDELIEIVGALKKDAKSVGFTSGVFDLLHPGHVAYLEAAKEKCDVLVLALNSDDSVRANKGPERPINNQDDRARVISGLNSVDYVFVFSETNNNTNVDLLKPEVYLKAGDYDLSKLSSAPIVEKHGGRVELVPFEKGLSSSDTIDRIKGLAITAMPDEWPSKEFGPAAFIDRDGTINVEIDYLHEPEKLEIIPGVIEAVKSLRDAGYKIVIVTNQAGIGLGYFSKEDFFRVNKKMLTSFWEAGVIIDRIYFSPFSPADGTECRKPRPGMLLRGARELNIDMPNSFMIGDMLTDIKAGKSAGCKTILVRTGHGKGLNVEEEPPDYIADDLADAAKYIISSESYS